MVPARPGASSPGSARPGSRTRSASTTSDPGRPSSRLHRERDFATIAAAHHGHRLVVSVERELVGQEGTEVHVPAPEEAAHLVPSLVHEPAVDSVHRNAFRNHLGRDESHGPMLYTDIGSPPSGAC